MFKRKELIDLEKLEKLKVDLDNKDYANEKKHNADWEILKYKESLVNKVLENGKLCKTQLADMEHEYHVAAEKLGIVKAEIEIAKKYLRRLDLKYVEILQEKDNQIEYLKSMVDKLIDTQKLEKLTLNISNEANR